MRILNFNDFICESNENEEERVLTPRQLKRLKYFVKKENEVVKYDDLVKYDIPDKIKEHMKTWPIINKSPYSDSFYSSLDIDWGSKPEDSFRVSDHWNYTTIRDGKQRKHCRTDKSVPTTSHLTLAQYKDGIYHVIMCEPTDKHLKKVELNKNKLKHLMDPDTIYQKKVFKNRIANGEIYAEITIKNKTYKGRVYKYTGQELKLIDENNIIVFNEKYLMGQQFKLTLYDKDGNEIEDILKRF